MLAEIVDVVHDLLHPCAPFSLHCSAVCSESISGIVCGLLGFATAMLLEFLFSWWLLALCVEIGLAASTKGLDGLAFFVAFCFLVLPYWCLLLVRCYCLSKAQAYRRALQGDADFRNAQGEQTLLVRKTWGGA